MTDVQRFHEGVGMKITDKERIDWLNKQQGSALVSDDNKHWAVVSDGFQNVPLKTPSDISTTFFIKKKDWCKTIRQAIDKQIVYEKAQDK